MEHFKVSLLKSSGWFALVLCLSVQWLTAGSSLAQASYNVGDQVEVQWPGDNQWYKAKVTEVRDGKFLIIYDQDGLNALYQPDRMRLIKAAPVAATAPMPPQVQAGVSTGVAPNGVAAQPTTAAVAASQMNAAPGSGTVDADGTLSADRPILPCPIKQPHATNGQAPDAALLERLIRCAKGEKPAAKGGEGAVTIDVSKLSIGKPRAWNPLADSGSGANVDYTIVYPVEVTYTERTFYYTRTVVSANWMRVINFYVDGFNEWRICSEETVKAPEHTSAPRAR